MTWISNGPVRPSSSRIWLSRLISRSSSSGLPPPCIQPSQRAARRSAASAWPPTRIGIGFGRRRCHLGFRDVVELAVELEVLAGREPLDDLDALVHPLAAPGERDTHQLVVLGPRAGADAEPEPVVEQRRQRPGLLGHQRRWPDRQLQHEEVELQRRGDRAQRAGQHERLDERLAVQELPVAVRGVRVLRVGLERVATLSGIVIA